jgi:O-antigen/teichoic acid export membrane protein
MKYFEWFKIYTEIQKKFSINDLHSKSFKFLVISVITKFASFIVYPLLARHFGVVDFGSFDFYIVFITIISTIGLLGMDSMIYRYLHDPRIDEPQSVLVSGAFFVLIVTLIFLSFLLFVFLEFNFFGIKERGLENVHFLSIYGAVVGMVIYSFTEVILRLEKSLRRYFYLLVSNSILFLTVTYVSTVYFDVGLTIFLDLYAVVYLILGTLGLLLVRDYLSFGQFKLLRLEYFSYAVPLALTTLIPLIQAFFYRNYIMTYLDQAQVGLFAAGSKILILYSLPALAVYNTTIPVLLSRTDLKNYHKLANNYLLFTLLICTYLLINLSLYNKEIVFILFGDEFELSGYITILLVFSAYVLSISSTLSIGSLINNGSKYRFLNGLFIMLLSLILGDLFIKNYGLFGLLVSICCTSFIQMISDVWIGQKFYKIEWEFIIVIIFILISMFLSAIFISVEFLFILKLLFSFLLGIAGLLFYRNYHRNT